MNLSLVFATRHAYLSFVRFQADFIVLEATIQLQTDVHISREVGTQCFVILLKLGIEKSPILLGVVGQ